MKKRRKRCATCGRLGSRLRAVYRNFMALSFRQDEDFATRVRYKVWKCRGRHLKMSERT